MEASGMCELSVLPAQFSCESKTALKSRVYYKNILFLGRKQTHWIKLHLYFQTDFDLRYIELELKTSSKKMNNWLLCLESYYWL